MLTKLQTEIRELCKANDVAILAHYYQTPEIQEIADHVADSLGMAQYGSKITNKTLLVAGVVFMGETAKIISPEKTVLVPDIEAGCSLADNCPANEFKKFIDSNPNHTVVTYVNCSVEVKALSDILVTSSNAVKIINSIPKDQPIIFAPDKHLGTYLKKITGRDLLLWEGSCMVHDTFEAKELVKLKMQHPDALVLAHPECPENILDLANHIGSTQSILDFSNKSTNKKFIIVTETGILHPMTKMNPAKEFIPLANSASCNCAECPYMKLNTLEKIKKTILGRNPEILVEESIRKKALIPLEKMLLLSK